MHRLAFDSFGGDVTHIILQGFGFRAGDFSILAVGIQGSESYCGGPLRGATAGPLRGHCGATARPLRGHCGATAGPLRVTAGPLRGHCGATAGFQCFPMFTCSQDAAQSQQQ